MCTSFKPRGCLRFGAGCASESKISACYVSSAVVETSRRAQPTSLSFLSPHQFFLRTFRMSPPVLSTLSDLKIASCSNFEVQTSHEILSDSHSKQRICPILLIFFSAICFKPLYICNKTSTNYKRKSHKKANKIKMFLADRLLT